MYSLSASSPSHQWYEPGVVTDQSRHSRNGNCHLGPQARERARALSPTFPPPQQGRCGGWRLGRARPPTHPPSASHTRNTAPAGCRPVVSTSCLLAGRSGEPRHADRGRHNASARVFTRSATAAPALSAPHPPPPLQGGGRLDGVSGGRAQRRVQRGGTRTNKNGHVTNLPRAHPCTLWWRR